MTDYKAHMQQAQDAADKEISRLKTEKAGMQSEMKSANSRNIVLKQENENLKKRVEALEGAVADLTGEKLDEVEKIDEKVQERKKRKREVDKPVRELWLDAEDLCDTNQRIVLRWAPEGGAPSSTYTVRYDVKHLGGWDRLNDFRESISKAATGIKDNSHFFNFITTQSFILDTILWLKNDDVKILTLELNDNCPIAVTKNVEAFFKGTSTEECPQGAVIKKQREH